MDGFDNLMLTAVGEGYSDVHITGGHPIVFRKNGVVSFERGIRWSHEQIDRLVSGLLTPWQLKILRRRSSVDLAMSVSHVRLRINVFNTIRGLSIAIRILPGTIPSIPWYQSSPVNTADSRGARRVSAGLRRHGLGKDDHDCGHSG